MICIKSYSTERAGQLAEELATEMRTQFKAGRYLYEWGAEDRNNESRSPGTIPRENPQRVRAVFGSFQKDMKSQGRGPGPPSSSKQTGFQSTFQRVATPRSSQSSSAGSKT